MATLYYSMFDPARLATQVETATRQERIQRACGTGMFDLLVGGHAVVLSQNQIFDSPWLLDLVATGGDDALGVLDLIRASWIQTRIHVPGGAAPVAGVGPHTVRGAFVRALQSSHFVFSTWPELDDPACRQEVTARVTGASLVPLSDDLERRLDALLQIDRKFVTSRSSEVGLAGQVVQSLAELVREDVAHRTTSIGSWSERYRGLDSLAEEGPDGVSLETRSGWYRLIERALSEGKADDEVARVWRGVVDVQYNRRVASSLSADRARVEADDPTLVQVLDGVAGRLDDDQIGATVSRLGERLGITWRLAADLLRDEEPLADDPAGAVLMEAARRRRVEALVQDGLARQVSDSRVVVNARNWLAPSIAIAGEAAGLAMRDPGITEVAGMSLALLVERYKEPIAHHGAQALMRLRSRALAAEAGEIRSASLTAARRHDR